MVDVTFYAVIAAVLLFFFFIFLMLRRTYTGFKEGMEESARKK